MYIYIFVSIIYIYNYTWMSSKYFYYETLTKNNLKYLYLSTFCAPWRDRKINRDIENIYELEKIVLMFCSFKFLCIILGVRDGHYIIVIKKLQSHMYSTEFSP